MGIEIELQESSLTCLRSSLERQGVDPCGQSEKCPFWLLHAARGWLALLPSPGCGGINGLCPRAGTLPCGAQVAVHSCGEHSLSSSGDSLYLQAVCYWADKSECRVEQLALTSVTETKGRQELGEWPPGGNSGGL